MTLLGYLLALILTIISEVAVTSWVGYKKKVVLAVILVNLISHPIFGFVLWNNELLQIISLNWFWIIFFEFVIVLVESWLLFFALEKKWLQWLKLSFLMNGSSFLLGLAIFGVSW